MRCHDHVRAAVQATCSDCGTTLSGFWCPKCKSLGGPKRKDR